MNGDNKRIGIFGGTFDPVHNGHVAISKSFLNSGHIDELWVFLNPAPPHKPHRGFAPYTARLKMLQAAFREFDNVRISDLEKKLSEPCYTIQTLSHLEQQYPRHEYYLCIGGDSFRSFKSWYKWKEILEQCTLLVADRPAQDDEKASAELWEHALFVEHQPVEVSSSEIRHKVRRGGSIRNLVPEAVRAVIDREKLYTF